MSQMLRWFSIVHNLSDTRRLFDWLCSNGVFASLIYSSSWRNEKNSLNFIVIWQHFFHFFFCSFVTRLSSWAIEILSIAQRNFVRIASDEINIFDCEQREEKHTYLLSTFLLDQMTVYLVSFFQLIVTHTFIFISVLFSFLFSDFFWLLCYYHSMWFWQRSWRHANESR